MPLDPFPDSGLDETPTSKLREASINTTMALKHPDGSVQGLSSAAVGFFALLVAFIGYTGFNSSGAATPWKAVDAFHLIPAGLAVIFLTLVPWLATQRRKTDELGKSIEAGRICFGIGALLTVLAILVFVFRDFFCQHP
jgi:hypothetical protein